MQGRVGSFCKIKIGGKIKFKIHVHNNCFYGRGTYPEVRELQCLLQNTYNDLINMLKNRNTRFLICK